MADFAKLDQSNHVRRVLTLPEDQAHRGAEYLEQDLGLAGPWVQTCQQCTFRNKFAGIGDFYSEEHDIFVDRSPFPSWILDETGEWQPPVPQPDGDVEWDEETHSWVFFENEENDEEDST